MNTIFRIFVLSLLILLPLFVSNVIGHGYGWQNSYQDCHGDCGDEHLGQYNSDDCYGDCGHSSQVVEVPSNDCWGDCGGTSKSNNGYSSDHTSHSSSSSSQSSHYQYSTSWKQNYVTLEQPQPVVQKSYYSTPTVVKRTYYTKPTTYYHTPKVSTSYSSNGCSSGSGCGNGGGSKIIKVIKKTTYTSGNGCGPYDDCNTNNYHHDDGYNDYSYQDSEPVVIKKITRVITQPKVVKVVKYVGNGGNGNYGSGRNYNSGNNYGSSRSYSSGRNYGNGRHYGGQSNSCGSNGCNNNGGATAYAFASASASSGGGGGGGGNYGPGCKFGCDSWK